MLIFPAALGHAQQPPSIPQNLPGNAQLVVSLLLHLLICILSWFPYPRGFPVARMLLLIERAEGWTHGHAQILLFCHCSSRAWLKQLLRFPSPVGKKMGIAKLKMGLQSSAELGAWKLKPTPRIAAIPSFKATLPTLMLCFFWSKRYGFNALI